MSEFQKAADAASTTAESKSAVSNAVTSIGKLGTTARQGDAGAAKKAFVAAVSSLQSWAAETQINVAGL